MNQEQEEYYQQSLVAMETVIDEVIQLNKDIKSFSLRLDKITSNIEEYVKRNSQMLTSFRIWCEELDELAIKMEDAKRKTGSSKLTPEKTVRFSPYIISELPNGSIQVRKGNIAVPNTVHILRIIAKQIGIKTHRPSGREYTTRELGRIVIRALMEDREVSTGKVSTGKVSTGKVSTGKVSTGKVPTGKVPTRRGQLNV